MDSPALPDEIAITPAMIAAGVAVLAGYDKDYEGFDQAVTRIYSQMALAKKRPRISKIGTV